MKQALKKSFLQCIFLFASASVVAQQTWPSPEVAQMYRHAQEYSSLGNIKDAIIVYKQAILLAPGETILYKGFARALYAEGNFSEAEQTLNPLLAKHVADTGCYLLLAECQAAQKEMKAAKNTIKKGLLQFPGSGALYNERGKIYNADADSAAALTAWLDGIQKDPTFAENYHHAALAYLASQSIDWGLLYGEMYLDMQRDNTTGDEALKKKIFIAYKTMFDNIAAHEVTSYGKVETRGNAATFLDAVRQVYTSLTPVVSDGITTENLVMARTRFLMDWFAGYDNRYPFSLFRYMDELVKSGHFEIYNEWLFGKAENEQQYKAWDTFHEGDISRFLAWRKMHFLSPNTGDFYNDKDIHNILK